jgi:hypothetical protein
MTNRGIVPVEVKPTTVPQPNGEMKLGAGAADLSPRSLASRRPDRILLIICIG